MADAAARGVTQEQFSTATCYVTLEPCHRGPGKTTPPFDEALVACGLRSVHIALMDPDPAFGNAGVSHLEGHGVEDFILIDGAGKADLKVPQLLLALTHLWNKIQTLCQ